MRRFILSLVALLITVSVAYATLNRAVPTTGDLDVILPDLNEELNYLFGTNGSVLTSVTGTNTIDASIEDLPNIVSLTEGLCVRLEPVNTTTGAVTLDIDNVTGDKAVVDLTGTALSAINRLIAGNQYVLCYSESPDDHWRVMTQLNSGQTPNEHFCIAASDSVTSITTGTAKETWRMPYAFVLTGVRASVNTAPVGSTIIIDINEGGSTILGTKLSIDASEETSVTAASAATITDASLADDSEMTIDFDQVGSTTPGKGVKVCLLGNQQ